MCGIVGRVNYRSAKHVDPGLIAQMTELVAHRGPDGVGLHVDREVGFGHRRLAIIDLSPAGAQPMSYADGRVWIVYNGEVYNFPRLRAELEQRGHRFRSNSDTEVMLAAYLEFGTDCVTHFRGMFAFALWDARERLLLLARDRLGKKPLCYWLDDDGIAFASEPKAFLADNSFVAAPDWGAISHYLTYQYVPHPMTAFAGVRKLPPAHRLVVRNGRGPVIDRYWSLPYVPKFEISEAEAEHEVIARLSEAVRLRLISDVPLGAFLSGGVDSGVVVALMAQHSAAPVRTFSIGFEEAPYDERRFARLVAERYGTDHHELVVRPDALELFDKLVWHYGEPFADSSAIPTFHLARLTRQHVTVALNGDGGDENVAGYDRYLANVLAARLGRMPPPLRAAVARAAGLLPRRSL